jgi:hypothetical protein
LYAFFHLRSLFSLGYRAHVLNSNTYPRICSSVCVLTTALLPACHLDLTLSLTYNAMSLGHSGTSNTLPFLQVYCISPMLRFQGHVDKITKCHQEHGHCIHYNYGSSSCWMGKRQEGYHNTSSHYRYKIWVISPILFRLPCNHSTTAS